MRKIDQLKHTLEHIEILEYQFKNSLDTDKALTQKAIDIKAKIDALRTVVCEEVKQSILRKKK